MGNSLFVTSSPHVHCGRTSQGIMLDVIIALLPASIAGVIFFGLPALAVILISVAAAVLTEFIINKLTKKPVTVGDCSAIVTGLLIALNMPPTIPLFMPVIGAVFAITIVKMLFGGLGHNFVNPALAARAVLVTAYGVAMTTWVSPFDAVTSATPLAIMEGVAEGTLPSLGSMFLGNIAGCIGETSALALLVGGAYLLVRRVINWRIPVCFIVTASLLSWLISGAGSADMILYQALAGGLFLGAIFMATDYTTSPITPTGQIIFAVGCGVITALIRTLGAYPEGVSYSILIMNLVTPLINRATRPRVYGHPPKRVAKAQAKAKAKAAKEVKQNA